MNIMHIDMDAFFASIEQQVNPKLRGKPVIVGGRNNRQRSIICAASYEAKARGITNAMPSWKALRICPEAIFVPADTSKYVYASNQIHELLKTFSPQVEKFSVDEFFLDVTGCQKLIGSPEEIGRQIKARIKKQFGITATIGVAPTRTTAKLVAKAHKPDGLCVVNEKQLKTMLKYLPVEKICGIGQRLKARFNRLGIRTCGQLAEYPDEVLQSHFGIIGIWLKQICRVQDVSDIEYYERGPEPPKSVGHSQTLREMTTDQEFIKEWIYLLSEMVAQRMRRQQLQGRTVHFYISDGFGGGRAKQKTYDEPTYDGCEIYHRALHIIKLLRIKILCARVLAVSVSHLTPADTHYLFQPQIRRDRLLHHIDAINHKYGEWTIYPAKLKGAVY